MTHEQATQVIALLTRIAETLERTKNRQRRLDAVEAYLGPVPARKQKAAAEKSGSAWADKVLPGIMAGVEEG